MSITDEPIAWEKYPKMPLSTQSWESLRDINEWIVTEKVHGANFSATVSDTSCTFAKRSGPLPDDEDFYSFRSQQLDKMMAPKSAQLLRLVRGGAAPSALAVCIFGELCGGAYPHSEVPKISQLAPVQNGVWYSPRLEFLGFDVAVAERGAAGVNAGVRDRLLCQTDEAARENERLRREARTSTERRRSLAARR